jgi:hypothetical protein
MELKELVGRDLEGAYRFEEVNGWVVPQRLERGATVVP